MAQRAEVGAKHQNGCAEWSIQTIMSMAHTFMIHVLLYWDEQGSDAVALWLFCSLSRSWASQPFAKWSNWAVPNGYLDWHTFGSPGSSMHTRVGMSCVCS